MSAAHDDHAHAAPEQPEISHPALWSVFILAIASLLAWLFFHFLFAGMHVARHHHKIHVHQAGEPEPDHLKLMAHHTDDVLDKGASVYNAKCASCHGAQGNSNPTNLKPVPRNFHTDSWKNKNGGGPYALYLVLEKGLGTMPAFPGLSAEEKYAVNHFINYTWVKPFNKEHFVEMDNDAIVKTIPPPGAAGEHGKGHHPNEIVVKVPVRSLLAGMVKAEEPAVNMVQVWAEAARASAPAESQRTANHFVDLVKQEPGLAIALKETVAANQPQQFATLLAGSDGTGNVRAYFNLLSTDELHGLFALLKGGK
jgi:cytochrome c5